MQDQSTGSTAAAHQQEAAPVAPPASPTFLPPQSAKNNNNKSPSTGIPNKQLLKTASNFPLLVGGKPPMASPFLQKPQVNQPQNMNTVQQVKPSITDYQNIKEPANNDMKDLTTKTNNADKFKMIRKEQPINEDEYDR